MAFAHQKKPSFAPEVPMESSTVPSVSLGPAGQADAEVRKPAQLGDQSQSNRYGDVRTMIFASFRTFSIISRGFSMISHGFHTFLDH